MRYGGESLSTDNLHNSESLDWVLQAMQYPVFSEDLYPTLPKKAAILAWTIIVGHVFFDGNKRTGLFCLLRFLEINHFTLDVSSEDVKVIALKVANYRDEEYSIDLLSEWIESNIQVKRNR